MSLSATLLIIIMTCIVSFIGFQNPDFFNKFKHHPYSEHRNKEYYRWVTSGFLHADLFHLGVNMYVLWGFGQFLESVFRYRFQDEMIGASGGVSGVLFAFIILNPWEKLYLYFALPIPAIVFGILYLVYSSWASNNKQDNIGHDAHFFGALAGIGLTILLIPNVVAMFVEKLLTF